MFKFVFPFLVVIFVVSSGFQAHNVCNNILEGLKNNDSKALVKHFGSTVNLSLKGEERITTKF